MFVNKASVVNIVDMLYIGNIRNAAVIALDIGF